MIAQATLCTYSLNNVPRTLEEIGKRSAMLAESLIPVFLPCIPAWVHNAYKKKKIIGSFYILTRIFLSDLAGGILGFENFLGVFGTDMLQCQQIAISIYFSRVYIYKDRGYKLW